MAKLRSQFFNYSLDFKSIKSPQQMAKLQKDMEAAVKLYSKGIFMMPPFLAISFD